jgi:hypothetical protein
MMATHKQRKFSSRARRLRKAGKPIRRQYDRLLRAPVGGPAVALDRMRVASYGGVPVGGRRRFFEALRRCP